MENQEEVSGSVVTLIDKGVEQKFTRFLLFGFNDVDGTIRVCESEVKPGERLILENQLRAENLMEVQIQVEENRYSNPFEELFDYLRKRQAPKTEDTPCKETKENE